MLKQDSDWSNGSTNQSFSAGEADMNIPGISFTQSPNQSGVKVVTKTTTTTTKTTSKKSKKGVGQRSYGDVREDPIRDALTGRQLRVNIKAKQGTAVKISPSPTPPSFPTPPTFPPSSSSHPPSSSHPSSSHPFKRSSMDTDI